MLLNSIIKIKLVPGCSYYSHDTDPGMLVPVTDENFFKELMYCRHVISIVNMRVARPILEKK